MISFFFTFSLYKSLNRGKKVISKKFNFAKN
jgi:hypothetical protein